MALERIGGSRESGVAFLVAGGIVFEIIAACCSSPQTTELNADKRADTLLKWVNVGVGTSALFVVGAVAFDPGHATPIIAGSLLAGGLMYFYYWHAKKAGLESSDQPTEDW